MEQGNLKDLIALDVDSSDNLTEEMLFKFIQAHGGQLHGKVFQFGIHKIFLRGEKIILVFTLNTLQSHLQSHQISKYDNLEI